MPTFESLYRKILLASLQNKSKEELANLAASHYDQSQLDCLLYPSRHPVVWRTGDCNCSTEERQECIERCPFDAMRIEGENVVIDAELCVGCGECVVHCKDTNLQLSKDGVAALEGLRNKKGLAYALIAPAFLGQFGGATPGQLRTAFRKMGFDGMIEVALFADILTLKEALEFDQNINDESAFQLTSCCCPMWIGMIRKVYGQLMPHVPASVSPMIACGRTIKFLHPDALTVFVGPCVAKKAEAREPDLAGAIDYVLTFKELKEMFTLLEIDPATMEESEKEISSRAGRIYARAGGVSEAVAATLDRIRPGRKIALKSRCADGVKECRALMNDLLEKKLDGNFFEGMGCVGGCVGGPHVLIDKEDSARAVNEFGDAAMFPTPIDNPYVVELLRRLNLKTTEELLENSRIFTRTFSPDSIRIMKR